MDGKMALYREWYFPNCIKIMVNEVILWVLGGDDRPPESAPD